MDFLPDWTGAFRPRRFRSARNWRRKSNRWAACCCNFIARSICFTAKALKANSRNGSRAGWISANRRTDRASAFARVQKRRAARHPARHFADGKRPQHHRTRFRARRHRADGVAESNLLRIAECGLRNNRRTESIRHPPSARRLEADGSTLDPKLSAVRMACCAGLNPSLATRSRFTSSFRRKRRRIGRRWNGWRAIGSSEFKFKFNV